METKALAELYQKAHNLMRNSDGLQPQEALDELLKYLFLKQQQETQGAAGNSTLPLEIPENRAPADQPNSRRLREEFSKYAYRGAAWLTSVWPGKGFSPQGFNTFSTTQSTQPLDTEGFGY